MHSVITQESLISLIQSFEFQFVHFKVCTTEYAGNNSWFISVILLITEASRKQDSVAHCLAIIKIYYSKILRYTYRSLRLPRALLPYFTFHLYHSERTPNFKFIHPHLLPLLSAKGSFVVATYSYAHTQSMYGSAAVSVRITRESISVFTANSGGGMWRSPHKYIVTLRLSKSRAFQLKLTRAI